MQSSELMLLPSYNFLQSDFQDPHQHPSITEVGIMTQSMSILIFTVVDKDSQYKHFSHSSF